MSAYTNWSLGTARIVARRELMDLGGKWWSDTELNQYIGDWQNELQTQYEFVWGTATITTAINTLTLGTITPPLHRLDAVYYSSGTGDRGYRLSGRLLQDLEVGNIEWRDALPDTPRAVIQYDSTQMIVWPPLQNLGTFIFEYPQTLSFASDSTLISLPPWTQWSLKPYVAMKAYLRPGPTNDLKRAMRYKAKFEREKQRIKLLWDNWLPERYRKLKPAHHYEFDILFPPPAWAANQSASAPTIPDSFRTYIPPESVNGINTSFSVPVVPTAMKLFVNGILQQSGVDYTLSGSSILMSSPPRVGDLVLAWVFVKGN